MEADTSPPVDLRLRKFLGSAIVDLMDVRTRWKSGNPGRMVSSNSRGVPGGTQWKVRKAYFDIVLGRIERLLVYGGDSILTIRADLKRKIKYAFAVFRTEAFTQRLTTQKDIHAVDRLVDEVIVNLKEQFEREFLEQLAQKLQDEQQQYTAAENHTVELPVSIDDSSSDIYQSAA